MKKITLDRKIKNDLLLTASIIIVAAVVFFIIGLNSQTGDRLEVKQNGELIASYSLSENREIRFENGAGYNLLVIENGEAYISSASCPDRICIRSGKISKNGESLVCLPNKTVITVRSEDQKGTDF